MSLFFSSTIVCARTYLPSGCSTYVSCKESKNDKGELHGVQTCYHASKKDLVLIKAFWQNDKLEKDFFCANDDGVPVVQAHYKDGELDGEYKTYNSSEKKWGSTTPYKNGKREGVAVVDISNDRKRVTLYKDDYAYGFTLILEKNGKVMSLDDCRINNTRKDRNECEKIKIPGYEKVMNDYLNVQSDKKNADDNRVVETKYANGAIKERYKMVDGKIVGQRETFYQNGKPSSVEEFNDGKRVEEKTFFEDGQIESHKLYKDAWNYKTTLYYQNGKKKFEKSEKENSDDKFLTDVDYKYYHDNGQVSEEGRNLSGAGIWGSDGVYNGEIIRFAKSGHEEFRCSYKKNKATGKCSRTPENDEYDYFEIYDDKGVLTEKKVLERKTEKQVKRSEFFPDGSTKSEVIDPDYAKKHKK